MDEVLIGGGVAESGLLEELERLRNLWRSRASRELGKGNVEPKVIQSAVAEVFSDFPARTTAR